MAMKAWICSLSFLISISAFAKCQNFAEAMDFVAKQISEDAPRHGPVWMTTSGESASGEFEVIAIFEEDGIVRAMHCPFVDPKSCTPLACAVDHATLYP